MTFSRFRNQSINTKLTVTIIFSCLLVSLMASGFFVGREIISFRRSVVEDLSGLAGVIGINCAAPLEFIDSETADEILSSLSVRPHILQALLYAADGMVFAQYNSSSLSSQEIEALLEHLKSENMPLPERSYHFHKDHIDLSIPIGEPGKIIGTIVLQADQDEFHAILTRLVYAVCGIFIAALLLAFFFSSMLNRVISKPILALADTMGRVRSEENYSIRAVKDSGDELGVLVEGVNSMLDGIEQRDEQLLVAKKVAEDANMAKSQFLAQMSHEIRTPMNGVLGIARLLLNTPLDEKQSQFVHSISRSGESLLSLINDILDFSKIEAGRLELERIHFDLRQVTEETIDLLSKRAGEKGVNLACFIHSEVPAYVVGDLGRLRQVLMNLLGNALKFTPRGEVALSVSLEKTEGDTVHLRFEVKDSGIGIAPEKQEEIFSAFSQADGSTTRKFGGTGLGLAISRQLVNLMGGEIGLESVKGQGSTFWFTTMFNIGSFSKSITDRQHQAAVPVKFDASILVAEDNATNQIVAQGTLEYLGCSVDLAENGREAVARAAEKHYDLILMDCQMPVMDGYEATESIRKAEHQAGDKRTPVIALTAHAMKGDRERCLAVGMDDYLTKPFSQQQLANMLSAWLPGNGSSVLPEPVKDSPQEGDELSTCNSIDRSVLDNLSQLQQPGKPDIIKQLVTVYLQRSPKVLQDIHEAAESNDIEKLWQAVHSLKSSSAILGACRLASLCHELEVLGRENQVDDPVRIAQEIKAEFKVVADELERILSCR